LLIIDNTQLKQPFSQPPLVNTPPRRKSSTHMDRPMKDNAYTEWFKNRLIEHLMSFKLWKSKVYEIKVDRIIFLECRVGVMHCRKYKTDWDIAFQVQWSGVFLHDPNKSKFKSTKNKHPPENAVRVKGTLGMEEICVNQHCKNWLFYCKCDHTMNKYSRKAARILNKHRTHMIQHVILQCVELLRNKRNKKKRLS
ncbi:hypothetical protein RFI_33396, partial [Reticulomyxa filosa]